VPPEKTVPEGEAVSKGRVGLARHKSKERFGPPRCISLSDCQSNWVPVIPCGTKTMSDYERPKGIKETAVLMSILNATGFAIIDWSKPHPYIKFSIFTTIILVGYIVLWFYWKGRNWARILVLLTSLLCLYNLYHWNHFGLRGQIMVGAEALLAIFLLYWLNTPKVRAFFTGAVSQ
jgi:hypothetical protein